MMVAMKEGYKQTDIGVIPEDWEVKSYGEVFDFLSTISNSRADLCFKGDFGYIHYGDIHIRWENTLDLSKDELPQLRRDKIKKLPASLRDGDLVMADTSEDYEGIAKTVEIKNIGDKKVFSGLHTFLMRDRNAVFSDGIRGYIHEMPVVRQQIKKVATGLKVFGVSKSTLKNVLIPLPKPEEQKAIAAVLSDVDGLIESLEQLIAKKRDMKTAAMQQLLTGKKRLPGFEEKEGYKQTDIGVIPEDWDIKSYDEVFDFLSTISNSRADLCFKGDFGYIHYGDIHIRWENTLDLSKDDLPELRRDKIKKLPASLRDGDLVMADTSEDYEGIAKTVEIKNIGDKKVFSGLHTFLMRDRNAVFSDGIRGYIHEMPVVRQQIQKVATGLKVFGISKNTLKNILIPVPKPEEQTAITPVLSDMDAEIDALEQRLEKARRLKTGMMQELLTGRTRLIKTHKKEETA